MDIAVVGATGRTGRHVVAQAVERGHGVRAVARRRGPAAAPVVVADALDADAIDGALAGADAVISTLGVGTGRGPTELYSHAIANVLSAIAHHGIARLIVVSAAPAGPRGEQPTLERRVLMPLLELAFGGTYADMRRMEAALERSTADWIALRPPRLVDRPAVGHYRLSETPLRRGRRITCADLAAAALELVERRERSRIGLYVAE